MVSDKSFTFSLGTMSPLGFLVVKGKVGMGNGRIREEVEGQLHSLMATEELIGALPHP